MKTWFVKFRISEAMDSGAPLPPAFRRQMARSGELRLFAQQSASLESLLRDTRPQLSTPPWLHGWIMRSVRASSDAAQRQWGAAKLAWICGSAAAAIATAWVGWEVLFQRAPKPAAASESSSLTATSSVLSLSSGMTKEMPAALVSPLSEEMRHVNEDLGKTAAFLLASLP